MTAEGFPTEWTPEVARALAVPFAAEQIGRKPQGGQKISRDQYQRCNTCKPPQKAPPQHFHVDYVDHAVVTGRLNDVVGPHGWSYTITSVERDGQGNLVALIGEMTILGHTKGPEVGGPGGQAGEADDRFKSAISDYLKRAAARFGVGLDLWTKQALESAAAPPPPHEPAAPQTSKPGGANESENASPDPRPTADETAKGPAASSGPVADGTPPGFDHIRTAASGAVIRSWIKGYPDTDFREAVFAKAAETGVKIAEASPDDLRTLIEVAWKTRQAA